MKIKHTAIDTKVFVFFKKKYKKILKLEQDIIIKKIIIYSHYIIMKTIVITSWYFNPIHPWHIECLELCKKLWDELRVIINNDTQAKLKTWKQEVFQDEHFRSRVVSALKVVDETMISIDTDWSVCESIKIIADKVRKKYWNDTKIIFWKWGDRFSVNIPELKVCEELWIEIKDWLGVKTHNSSDYRAKV